MNVKFNRKYKKYFKLIEELKDLCNEGYLNPNEYYPDMAEINESLYDYVLVGLGIREGYVPEIGCIYTLGSINVLEADVKKGRRNKKRNKVRFQFTGDHYEEIEVW